METSTESEKPIKTTKYKTENVKTSANNLVPELRKFGTVTAVYSDNGVLLQSTHGHVYPKESGQAFSTQVIPESDHVLKNPTIIRVFSQVHSSENDHPPHMHEYYETKNGYLAYNCDYCSAEMKTLGTCFHFKLNVNDSGAIACCACDWKLPKDHLETTFEPDEIIKIEVKRNDESEELEVMNEDQVNHEPPTASEYESAQAEGSNTAPNSDETMSVSISALVDENGDPFQITHTFSAQPNHALMMANGDQYYPCAECPAKIARWSDLDDHGYLHLSTSEAVVCGLCGWFLGASKSKLQYHKNVFHRDAARGVGEMEFHFKCSSCQNKFFNFTQFKTHRGCW